MVKRKKQVSVAYAFSLLAQRAKAPVPKGKEFQGEYSSFFLTLKGNRLWCPVIDLIYLNKFSNLKRFK